MAKFKYGQTVMTRGIANKMEESNIFAQEIHTSVMRYLSTDWGELSEDDKLANEEALASGEDRLMGAYETKQGRIWIITEWDRSVTTILFPEEY